MTVLRSLLFSLLLLLPLFQAQAEPSAYGSASDIEQQLSALNDRQLPEEQRQAARQALENALVYLRQAAQLSLQLEELNKRLDQVPGAISEAEGRLAELQNQPLADFASHYANSGLDTLERLLAERIGQRDQWQQDLAAAHALLTSTRVRPERNPEEISANQARSAAITVQLDTSKLVTAEQRSALGAELLALEKHTALMRQELAGNSQLQKLGQAQRALLNEQIDCVEDEIHRLQVLINSQQRAASEKMVADLQYDADDSGQGSPRAREQAEISRLSSLLLDTTDRINDLAQRNLDVNRQLENLKQADQALEELLDVLQGSRLLTQILHEQRKALPRVDLDATLADRIADIRLTQFDLSQQRDAIRKPAAYVEQLLTVDPAQRADGEARQALRGLVDRRAELLERINGQLSTLLNEAITLQLNQRELQATTNQLRIKLDEQLFWIPSNKALDGGWLTSLPAQLVRQSMEIPLLPLAKDLWLGLKSVPFVFLPLLLLIAMLAWRRRWLAEQLERLQKNIGYVRHDRQWHTPLAIAINVLMCLPIPMFLALCGYALALDARGGNDYLGVALSRLALAWLVFHALYRLLSQGNVAELHFRWPRERTTYLQRVTLSIGAVVLPLSVIITIAEHHPAALGSDVIGVLVLLTALGLLTWLLPRLFWHRAADNRLSVPRGIGGLVAGALPFGLIIAVVAGYYYTALKLTGLLITSLFVVVLWQLVEAILLRGLSLAAQRLAYQRIIAKRETTLRDGEDTVEAPMLDIDQVNQQSLRLVRLGLLGIFLGLLYWVWADTFTVFAYLDRIVLYEYITGSGNAQALLPISLKDVLGAFAIVVVSLILARNIPGLLEMLVLSRMKLAQGSAYATTTLLSYIIFSVGFVVTLSTLGVSWDKLQWLVAALSVGLGFGLQEIFANFVSGLIILFERPARIGDVVTIGNLSGTVSRIRIRATTITDFDRKEIIVPNKVFVTGQVINWSLTDTITRVTIRLGVSYGSDLDKVKAVLLAIATDNPRVLKNPAPMVYLLNFGVSTLEHELRIYVRELGDRTIVIDEINRRIDELFTELGIDIAVTRTDVRSTRTGSTPPQAT